MGRRAGHPCTARWLLLSTQRLLFCPSLPLQPQVWRLCIRHWLAGMFPTSFGKPHILRGMRSPLASCAFTSVGSAAASLPKPLGRCPSGALAPAPVVGKEGALLRYAVATGCWGSRSVLRCYCCCCHRCFRHLCCNLSTLWVDVFILNRSTGFFRSCFAGPLCLYLGI